MSGYYNGYGGYEEWNGGNRTAWDNKNYNGYMEHDNRKSWEHGYGRDENFIKERNYCEQWPTPLEGRLLEMIEENGSTMEREQETGEVVDGKEKRMNRDTVMENSGEKNKDKTGNKRGLAWKIIYQNIRGLVTNSSRE